MERLRWQNTQEKSLSRILGTVSTHSDLEERKREHNIIKDVKIFFK